MVILPTPPSQAESSMRDASAVQTLGRTKPEEVSEVLIPHNVTFQVYYYYFYYYFKVFYTLTFSSKTKFEKTASFEQTPTSVVTFIQFIL